MFVFCKSMKNKKFRYKPDGFTQTIEKKAKQEI